MTKKKAILVIMDGWGLGQIPAADAIQNANTPFVSSLYSQYPNTTLITCGEAVGLPDGQMGNSEVGHTTIGAGTPLDTDLVRIDKAIKNGSFGKNKEIKKIQRNEIKLLSCNTKFTKIT